MMPDPRAFPGTPNHAGLQVGPAATTLTTALQTPPAGSRNYLLGFILSAQSIAAVQSFNLTLNNLDLGGGAISNIPFIIIPNVLTYLPYAFFYALPASALALAISGTVTSGGAAFNTQIGLTLFGYNVAE